MMLYLVLIALAKLRNMSFKNCLKFLTLKQLVSPIEPLLRKAVSSAIISRKWLSPKFLSFNKNLSKSWLKRLLWPILPISLPFQLQLLFANSMTSVLSMIFLVFLKLYPGMSTLLQRERLVSLRKILKSSISLLFLKGEHKLSSGITFCATIEPFVLRWKSLLWIYLVPTMTWLNSFFRVQNCTWSLSHCSTSKSCHESCACPIMNQFERNPMNTRLSSATENSFNRIAVNWVISDFIALLFVCT